MSRRRRRVGFRLKKQVAQGNSDEMNKQNNSAKINSSDNLEPNQANQVRTGAHDKREHGNQQRENDARTASASQSDQGARGASSPDSASSVAAGSVASESSGAADVDVELSAPRVVAQETPLVSHLHADDHADEAAQEEPAPEESAESEAGESEAEAAQVNADEEQAELQEHSASEESLASDDAADHDDVDEDAPSQHSEVSAQPDDDDSDKPAAEAQDETEPEAEAEAESEPEVDQEPEPETEALAEIKPAPEVAASLKSKAEAEKETEPEAKSESEPEPEPGSEPVQSADETQSQVQVAQPTSQPSTAEKVTQEVKVATSNALNQAKKSIVEENSKPKPRRVKAFDGLRGLAILAIIAFHTTPSLMPGGFLAVTVFFVLSGYLITRSLLGRMDRHRFNLLGYWGERILRIWPATLAAIAFAAGVAWVWLPSALTKIRSDAVPTALFATNWVQIFRQVPYFDQAGLPSPLTPFWFVALIMQFYLLWSVMLWLLHKLTRGNRGAMGWITLLLMLISTGLSCWLLNPMDVTRVYYGLDTRWAELMAGALIAFLTIRGSEPVH
ncbi:MAG: acyltransferase, partial [Aeriscardovia aeriphila]|nr:acyltransferase [Aeriscardovia aeriphila]